MENTLYRRPLPLDTIAFSSPEGRVLFAMADVFAPAQRAQLGNTPSGPLADELSNLRAQLAAIASPSACGA